MHVETNGRWTKASDHEPRSMQPIQCVMTHAHGETMTATLLMPSIEHAIEFTRPVVRGPCSPVMTLSEAAKVLAMLRGQQ